MLQQLMIESLKSFGDEQLVDLAPITLIYGPNSAGKSTLLQALLLLRQTLASDELERPELVTRGPLVDLGSLPGIIHEHEIERFLWIGMTFSCPVEKYVLGRVRRNSSSLHDALLEPALDLIAGPTSVHFGFGWDEESQTVYQQGMELSTRPRSRNGVDIPALFAGFRRMDGRSYALHGERSKPSWEAWIRAVVQETQSRVQDQVREPNMSWHEIDAGEAPFGGGFDPRFAATGLIPAGIITFDPASEETSLTHHEKVIKDTWDHLSQHLTRALTVMLGDMAYLGPLRRLPAHYYLSTGAHQRQVGREGEHVVEMLAREPGLETHVNEWLQQLQIPYAIAVGRPEDATFSDVLRLSLTDRRSGVRMQPGDVGVGIGQLLPIVVQCLVGRQSVICVEQPELHIHPRLQAEVADLLIETTREEPGNQVLVETHSESLMLRLQRRIREGVLPHDDVAALYVDPTPDGSATVKRLRLDRQGRFIDEWPSGFFEERLQETLVGFDN